MLLQAALSNLKAALGKGTVVANGGQNPHASGFMLETFMPSAYGQIQSGVKAKLENEVHTNMYEVCVFHSSVKINGFIFRGTSGLFGSTFTDCKKAETHSKTT
jgi:hypothetical protein